ncbi:MAG: hypothetical protein GF328_02930 [Candidatus Latescibacteria bacterium]|nr:hypothetical protein [Candidatus Latescibacterota bacterium]
MSINQTPSATVGTADDRCSHQPRSIAEPNRTDDRLCIGRSGGLVTFRVACLEFPPGVVDGSGPAVVFASPADRGHIKGGRMRARTIFWAAIIAAVTCWTAAVPVNAGVPRVVAAEEFGATW